MLLYGGMDDDEREWIKATFQARPQASPVRIPLATDAASEGILVAERAGGNPSPKLRHRAAYVIPNWRDDRGRSAPAGAGPCRRRSGPRGAPRR